MSKYEEEEKKDDKGIRLNRYLGNSGVCTRREADKLIAKGLVTVNGKVITEMGYRVQPGEKVVYEGKLQNAESKQYILVNKPKNCSLTHKRQGRTPNIYDLIENACWEKVEPSDPIGLSSTGLVLMTNDYKLVKKINVRRKSMYHLFLNQDVNEKDFNTIKSEASKNKGGEILDIQYANPEKKSELGIESLGFDESTLFMLVKNLGYHIDRMDRVMYAGLTKKNLTRGRWRFLSQKEIQFLKMQ